VSADVVVAAVVTAAAAAALTRRTKAIAATRSRWLDSGLHVVLAALGGAGAAALATSAPEAVAFATLALSCSLLVVIDLADHRLPNAIIGPTYPVFFGLLAVTAALNGQAADFLRACLAALAVTIVYFVLAFIAPSGMGLGDVKLSGLLGAFLGWLGWAEVLVGTLAAFVIGGLFAVLLLVARRARRDTAFPFGPWMVAGAVVGAAWGPAVLAG
jgi:leader peptidase (prepilin peptidase)/N-methyltransferase